MWLISVLDYLKSTSLRARAGRVRREAAHKKPAATRLILEALEDRCLLSFSPAVSYPVGTGPLAVMTGDFNGDGRLDLAVANQSSNTVSILLGKGDGTFQAAQNFATGAGPQSLAVGDFNGDGKPDLATAGPAGVSILLNNGNGTFAAPVNYGVGAGIYSVAVGDFNGDGKLDLVTVNANNTVSVLLGSGTGAFRSLAPFAAVSNPSSVAVGDFNNDGKLDLVMAGNIAAIAIGNGDGTFKPAVSTGYSASSVAVGDLNGDGKLDLVTALSTYTSGSCSYLTGVCYAGGYTGTGQVLIGRGDGTFTTGPDYFPSGGQPTAVAIADVNGDGKPDFVVAEMDTNAVTVFLNDGKGAFVQQADSAAGVGPAALAVGDFNADGFPDVVVANPGANGVSVLLNTKHWPSFDVSGFPATTVAGETHSVTVTALDNNKLLAGYTGTVHFASSDPQAVLPLDYTFVAADGGTHTFAVTLKTAGAQSIVVGDTVTGSSGYQITQVSAAALSRFGVDGFVTAQPIGTLGSFTVTPTDAFGNLVSGYTGTVHFTSTDPAAALPADYTFTAADTYGHSFDATFRTPGIQTITATDTAAPNITGSQAGIEVTGASTFAVYGFPTPIVAGTAGSFYVLAYDVYGQLVIGYSGTVHFTSTDPAAALPADYTFTSADQGAHTFAATLQTAGTQSITATAAANAGVTGMQGGITVDAAIKALTVAGFPSPVTAGVAGNLTVTARDANGNIATWYTGTVVFSSSDYQAALPATYTFTAADNGMHTFAATLKTAGIQSITATDTATGGLSGSEAGITVNPAAASRFLITAPSTVTSGVAFNLTVTVLDAYGNVVTGYTGTIRFKSPDHNATLPANYTFTAADKGVHTFTGLVLQKTGKQTLTITDTLNSALTDSVVEDVLAGPTKHK